jgi:hypothetical protein
MNTYGLPPVESAGTIAGMIEIAILISAGATIGAILLGLVALYQAAGMASLWLAVGLLFVLHLALQRRGGGYYDPGGAFGGGPMLPPPGKQRLPAPGPPQIGRSRRPALPGPKK